MTECSLVVRHLLWEQDNVGSIPITPMEENDST